MKKNYYTLGTLVLAAILVLPVIAGAQSLDVQADISASTSVRGPGPDTIREKMRAGAQNVKANQGVRNDALEQRRALATSTATLKEIRKELNTDGKIIRKTAQEERKNASSTGDRREIRKEMRIDAFYAHKTILVRQLNLALSNLKQIRERISSRIDKAEQSGRNMTEAKNLLVIADAKLGAAQVSVNVLANLSATSTLATTTATTSIQVRLERPRQVGATAIKAVKDAREALNAVVRAIAKNMGLGDKKATTTPSVSATSTTTVTATSTATTTTP